MVLDLILSFLWAFFISVFAIPSIINVAHFKKLLDEPNKRTVHVSLTPRLGGLAIFAGFTSAFTIFGDIDKTVQEVLAGAIVLFFIGLKDDIISVSPFKKFFVQVLATGIVVFMGDIRVSSFEGFMGIYDLDIGISYAFTFLLIIGVTNAINLIDGIDGLAGSLLVMYCCIFAYFFASHPFISLSPYTHLAVCLAGSILGFLRYNIRRAIIFMGDTGSLVCGFIVAVLAIKFMQLNMVPSSPAVAMSILLIPLVDTLRVFSIRILKGKSPFSPDRNHLHHLLKDLGLKPIYVVGVLVGLNFISFLLIYQLSSWSVSCLVGLMLLMALFLSFTLQILHKKYAKV